MARIDIYNKDIRTWSNNTKRKIKLKVARLTAQYSGHGQKDQKVQVGMYAGEASKIGFSFPNYMVFVHKGAGKGSGGSISGEYTNKEGKKSKTAIASMGKMGVKRKAKPFFNPVIENEFPQLGNIVADYKGDKTFLKIKKILIR